MVVFVSIIFPFRLLALLASCNFLLKKNKKCWWRAKKYGAKRPLDH
jgi:hypothetical protein